MKQSTYKKKTSVSILFFFLLDDWCMDRMYVTWIPEETNFFFFFQGPNTSTYGNPLLGFSPNKGSYIEFSLVEVFGPGLFVITYMMILISMS